MDTRQESNVDISNSNVARSTPEVDLTFTLDSNVQTSHFSYGNSNQNRRSSRSSSNMFQTLDNEQRELGLTRRNKEELIKMVGNF